MSWIGMILLSYQLSMSRHDTLFGGLRLSIGMATQSYVIVVR